MSKICFIHVFQYNTGQQSWGVEGDPSYHKVSNDPCLPLKAACGQLMHILFYSYDQLLRPVWHLSQYPNRGTRLNTKENEI